MNFIEMKTTHLLMIDELQKKLPLKTEIVEFEVEGENLKKMFAGFQQVSTRNEKGKEYTIYKKADEEPLYFVAKLGQRAHVVKIITPVEDWETIEKEPLEVIRQKGNFYLFAYKGETAELFLDYKSDNATFIKMIALLIISHLRSLKGKLKLGDFVKLLKKEIKDNDNPNFIAKSERV